MGFRRFMFRGVTKVRDDGDLACAALNGAGCGRGAERRLSIGHLRAAAGLLVRGGWRDVSSLWRSGARVALDASRRVERLLAGISRRRDPQLTLIRPPDSIAGRLESAWRKARADLEERWGAHVVAKRLGQLWEGPLRDVLGSLRSEERRVGKE